MGFFRKRNRNGDMGGGVDLSFLLLPLMIVLLICCIFGVVVWCWSTIETGKRKVVSEAFMDTFTLTVTGHAEAVAEAPIRCFNVSFSDTDLGLSDVIDAVRSYGFRPSDSENGLSPAQDGSSGVVRLFFKNTDEIDEEALDQALSALNGYEGFSLSLERQDADGSELRVVHDAIEDAKVKASMYMDGVFNLGEGVVTGVEILSVDYDPTTGTSSADVMMTLRTGGDDVQMP